MAFSPFFSWYRDDKVAPAQRPHFYWNVHRLMPSEFLGQPKEGVWPFMHAADQMTLRPVVLSAWREPDNVAELKTRSQLIVDALTIESEPRHMPQEAFVARATAFNQELADFLLQTAATRNQDLREEKVDRVVELSKPLHVVMDQMFQVVSRMAAQARTGTLFGNPAPEGLDKSLRFSFRNEWTQKAWDTLWSSPNLMQVHTSRSRALAALLKEKAKLETFLWRWHLLCAESTFLKLPLSLGWNVSRFRVALSLLLEDADKVRPDVVLAPIWYGTQTLTRQQVQYNYQPSVKCVVKGRAKPLTKEEQDLLKARGAPWAQGGGLGYRMNFDRVYDQPYRRQPRPKTNRMTKNRRKQLGKKNKTKIA